MPLQSPSRTFIKCSIMTNWVTWKSKQQHNSFPMNGHTFRVLSRVRGRACYILLMPYFCDPNRLLFQKKRLHSSRFCPPTSPLLEFLSLSNRCLCGTPSPKEFYTFHGVVFYQPAFVEPRSRSPRRSRRSPPADDTGAWTGAGVGSG